jgi:hypothetical protein
VEPETKQYKTWTSTSIQKLYSGGARTIYTGIFQCRQCSGPVEIGPFTGGCFATASEITLVLAGCLIFPAIISFPAFFQIFKQN